jgi:hypothetical protein
MAAPITPTKKLSNGKDHNWQVTTLSSTTSPTKVQIDAGLNVTGVLLADWDGITASTDKVTLPRVMLETSTTEVNGETTVSAADMQLTYDPQGAAASDGVKAYELLEDGFTGFLVRRQGVANLSSDAVTVGEFVDVLGIDVAGDAIVPGKTTAGPDGVYVVTVPISITSKSFRKAVA